MLLFLVDSKEENATDENLQRLNGMLKRLKANKRVGEQYMHTWMREQHIREEAREEGREEGRKEGSEEKVLSQICRKLRKGKSLEQIADELEEDISDIEPLYEVAQTFAPNYNEEQVFEAYKSMHVI